MEVVNEVTKCGGVVVVMEVTQPPVGVRTRARAMAVVTEATADNSGDVKRRKLGNERLNSPSSTLVETKTHDCEIHVHSVLKKNPNDSCDADSSRRSSDYVSASCCSSTGSMETLKVSSDLEERIEVESTAAKQSIGMNKLSSRVLPEGKMPPEAEIEEFFAAAQAGHNERFKNKYNYDIVNDIPLEGRFEWIQVKPRNDNGDGDEDEDEDD